MVKMWMVDQERKPHVRKGGMPRACGVMMTLQYGPRTGGRYLLLFLVRIEDAVRPAPPPIGYREKITDSTRRGGVRAESSQIFKPPHTSRPPPKWCVEIGPTPAVGAMMTITDWFEPCSYATRLPVRVSNAAP